MSILEQPERIAEEVAKRHAMIDDQQVAREQEQQALKSALARCDREERRWAETYAAEVISLDELKIYRADITRRRRDLQAKYKDLETRRQTVQQALTQMATAEGLENGYKPDRRSTKPSKSPLVSLWGMDTNRFIAHDRLGNRRDHGIRPQGTHQHLSFFHASLDAGWTPGGRVRVRRDDMAQLALQQNLGAALSVTSEFSSEALGGDLGQDSLLH